TGAKGAPVSQATPGNFMDWAYYHYGRYSFSTPAWWIPQEKEENPEVKKLLDLAHKEKSITRKVDLSRAKKIKITRDNYLEAQSRGMTLSELLETDEYDPSDLDSPLDAFERQLAANDIRVGGRSPITVELFYQNAPSLLPEFMLREIKRGQEMKPELGRLLASSTVISSNRYTPFCITGTPTDSKFSLRPIGDSAEIPSLVVAEQLHTITVPDYGIALKTSYKALRHRTTAQFKVLLWYIGFKIQADKMSLVMNTIINGDGNSNPATVVNTAASGSLTYTDLVTFWNEFYPFQMNTLVCDKNKVKTILTMTEFKDPLAGFNFQSSGELVSPLGSTLVRCDDVPSDLVIGLDRRFAIEEVISQHLLVEYDKIIQQKIEEAVISESVAYAKIIKETSLVLDTVWT
ncbi:MAG: hypothetical protein MUO85_01190, partial [candidate division Zixibacteria bacterium]|nr:hypothetical protein [candidate division Zixibacteria bacterium]